MYDFAVIGYSGMTELKYILNASIKLWYEIKITHWIILQTPGAPIQIKIRMHILFFFYRMQKFCNIVRQLIICPLL